MIEVRISSVRKNDSLEDCSFRKGDLPKESDIPDLISGTQTEDAAYCHSNVERYHSMRVEEENSYLRIDDYAMNAQKRCVVHGIFLANKRKKREEKR